MFDKKSRLLIVDDMNTMRKIVSKNCRELGFLDITEAADGNLAWQAIISAQPPFDIIISDWNMPNCTGLELLKRVRADEKYAKLPFLLVTAESEQSQIIEAIKAGVSTYIVKPFSPGTLQEKMEAVYKKIVEKK